MRSIAIVLLLGSMALAAPPRKPWPRWTDWVGSYEGKLAWKRCSAPGNKVAAISLVAVDGAMTAELGTAHAGLGRITLVSDDTGWTAKHADLAVTITRPRPNVIELKLALAAGCTMRAQLRRSTSNIAECDRLIGWARVERTCTKLAATRTEDLAKLVATRWTAADAAQCTARADKLERTLVDASCAPHPNPLRRGRGHDCTALQPIAAHIGRCSVPRELRDPYLKEVDELMAAIQRADGPEVSEVEARCREMKRVLVHMAAHYRCMKLGYDKP